MEWIRNIIRKTIDVTCLKLSPWESGPESDGGLRVKYRVAPEIECGGNGPAVELAIFDSLNQEIFRWIDPLGQQTPDAAHDLIDSLRWLESNEKTELRFQSRTNAIDYRLCRNPDDSWTVEEKER